MQWNARQCKLQVGRRCSKGEGGSQQRQGHVLPDRGQGEAGRALLTVPRPPSPVLPPPRGCGCAGRTPQPPRTNCICWTKLTTCDFRWNQLQQSSGGQDSPGVGRLRPRLLCLSGTPLPAPAVCWPPCSGFGGEAVLRPGGVGQHPTGRCAPHGRGRAGPPPGGIGRRTGSSYSAPHQPEEPLPVVTASLVSSTLG